MPDDAISITTNVNKLSPAGILTEDNTQLLTAYAISNKVNPETFLIFATHDDWHVKEAVAENPRTPIETLDYLNSDQRHKRNLTGNLNASSSAFVKILASSERGSEAYNSALSNENLLLEALIQTLIKTVQTSTAIAVKSNERFRELLSIARKLDTEGNLLTLSEAIFESNIDERWRWCQWVYGH